MLASAPKAGEYPGRWFDPAFKKDDDPERKAERLWTAKRAEAIAAACAGKPGMATEETKPSTQVSPLLYDLTSLQREANGRFGFSAKGTLALAQALYEKHKVLTYPRTDARALPEDYVATVKKTMEVLADIKEFAPFAKQVLKDGWVKPNKRIFDNSKISDHFAIIPTLQTPEPPERAGSEALRPGGAAFPRGVLPVRRVPADHAHHARSGEDHFRTDGRVMQSPGWLAVYGKSLQDETSHAARRSRRARKSKTLEVKADGQPDPAAGALHRGDAALGDGRRRQAGRGRRAARGDGRKGPGHAGHARRGHRRPDQREVRASATAAN